MAIVRTSVSVFSSESIASGAATVASDPIDLNGAAAAVAMIHIENQGTLTFPCIVSIIALVDEAASGSPSATGYPGYRITQLWGDKTSGSESSLVVNIPPAAGWIKFLAAAPTGGSVYVDASVVIVSSVA